jgi:ACS family glucarate transporter-like MFS transporter
MCLGLFAMNYVSYFFFTWFPVYLIKVHHMPMMKMGLVAAVPIVIAMFVELASGWFADRLYTKGWPITKVRKTLLVIGEVLGASIAIAVFAHTVVWVIIVMTICKSGQAMASSQVWALPGDVAPTNMASQVTALQNMVGNIAGALGPIVTGVILQVTHSFDLALFVIGALAVLGAMNFLFLLKKVEPITVPMVNALTGAAVAEGSAR